MKKAAVILANGFEEIEALTVVDVLRRAQIPCTVLGFDKQVVGSHGISVIADEVLDANVFDHDMIILPGGMPGSTNLKSSETVISILRKMQSEDKYIAAICAAPIVLEHAGVLKGKNYTCYDGFEKELLLIFSRRIKSMLIYGLWLEVRMTTDIKTEIGHRVRQKRERHKLTREEVCGQKLT